MDKQEYPEKNENNPVDKMKEKIYKSLAGLELPELSKGLKSQIDNYLLSVSQIDGRRGKKSSQEQRVRELAMTYYKLTQFIYSRDLRVDDIKSPEVQEAVSIKKRLFPLGIPKLNICIDGRVLSKTVAGLHGNALRTPAGDNVIEFLPKRKGDGLFLEEGEFSAMLDKALVDSEVVFEVLDSHIGCAAGELHSAERRGDAPEDHGLYDDVVRKKEMAAAMQKFVEEKYGGEKRLATFQISFDPRNGFCFTGLSNGQCLDDERVVGNGFTHEVMEELLNEGKIISTEGLVKNCQPLRELFAENYFEIEYTSDYRNSTNKFWTNIKNMSEAALPLIKEKMCGVFPELKSKKNEKDLSQQSLFILANAYNGFLHNYDGDMNKKDYPYGDHNESVVAVTYSEKGPFDRANSFSVTPNNPDLSSGIELGSSLIKNNRKQGRMSKFEKEAVSKVYGSAKEYVNNPVVTIFFERVFEEISADDIKAIRSVDWSDLPEIDWMKMDDSPFIHNYLNKKLPNIPAIFAEKINSLRKRAIEVYQPGRPATEAYLEGRLVPVWTLSGHDRETIALFPFLTKGY